MKRAIILAAVFIIAAGSVWGQSLKAYVIESEPMGYTENGLVKGEHVDYFRAIAERTGIDIEIMVVPKTKLFAALKSGDADLAISLKDSEWNEYVEYCGKVRDIRLVAVNRTGKKLNSYSDLYKSNRVGILAETSISKKFDDDTKIIKYYVPNYETMLRTMVGGRIDTGVGNAIVISYLTNKLGYDSNIQSQGLTMGTGELWIQFSNKSKHLNQLAQIKDVLLELKVEGTLDEILESYVGSDWKTVNSVEEEKEEEHERPEMSRDRAPAGKPAPRA